MHVVSTKFAKKLVWKREYEVNCGVTNHVLWSKYNCFHF